MLVLSGALVAFAAFGLLTEESGSKVSRSAVEPPTRPTQPRGRR